MVGPPEHPKLLEGKVAIVTGAGRGIGRAIALAYGRAGACVACAARTSSEIEDVAIRIREAGSRALAIPCDVTIRDQVEAAFERTVDEFGGLDLVVLNAGGLSSRGGVGACDADAWEATVRLNFMSTFFGARAAIPHLRARGGGKIITVGSGIGHRGTPEFSAYACAKAAQWMLTRVLAQELAEDRISVNELIPGPVATAADASAPQPGFMAREWFKQPDDVTGLALFLAGQPDHGPSAQSFSLMRRDN